jgi:hypothetical protein
MIYLDNAATSFPTPESVCAALDRFARHVRGDEFDSITERTVVNLVCWRWR